MRTLLVGERFNQGLSTALEKTFDDARRENDPSKYVRVMLRLRAFRERGADRFLKLGVEYDSSLNLLPPGRQDVKWDHDAAAQVASWVDAWTNPPWDLFLLAGLRVAKAFGLAKPRLCIAYDVYGLPCLDERDVARYVVLPHPSGLNRWWNDEVNVVAGRALIAEVMANARARERREDGPEERRAT